jgi:hypothetical protein
MAMISRLAIDLEQPLQFTERNCTFGNWQNLEEGLA